MQDASHRQANVFLLTRSWRDTQDGLELTFWGASESGPVCIVITQAKAVCFVSRSYELPSMQHPPRRRPVELRTLTGHDVDALYFSNQRHLDRASRAMREAGMRLYESTVRPPDRFLMERFITAGLQVDGIAQEGAGFTRFVNPHLSPVETSPHLEWLSFDIETDGLEGPVLSVAATCKSTRRAFVVRSPGWPDDWTSDASLAGVQVSVHDDERSLLQAFFTFVRKDDPDLLIGWNVVGFDLVRLQERAESLGVPLRLGRGGRVARVLPPRGKGQAPLAVVPGRAVLDGIDVLKGATWRFERFSLEFVSQALLGVGKTITKSGAEVDGAEVDGADKAAEIVALHRGDPASLVAYNVQDCVLVERVFEAADLVAFAMQRARLTGLAIDRRGGSAASFDNLYLPRLHRRGRVAPDVQDNPPPRRSPGGYVFDSVPGLHGTVLLLDFKSLYPSIIRTFLIDPLGLAEAGEDSVDGFLEASFSRDAPILPEIIAELWAARDRAKRASNKPLSTAIKIIMNSFYGVLGSGGCRFYDPRLASSITLRGHELLTRTRRWFEEERGLSIIYGDTDSLFVSLPNTSGHEESMSVGQRLTADVNAWWADTVRSEHDVESFLEMEFETCFEQFYMPAMRGSDAGTKKRYAGWERREGGHQLTIKGLEYVRSDTTAWVKRLQELVLRRVFEGGQVGELRAFISAEVDALRAGARDDELVVHRRLRRSPEEYADKPPPHVRAAMMLDRSVRSIDFVWTVAGPQPASLRDAAVDYDVYVDRHLVPALSDILRHVGVSVADVADRQLRLF